VDRSTGGGLLDVGWCFPARRVPAVGRPKKNGSEKMTAYIAAGSPGGQAAAADRQVCRLRLCASRLAGRQWGSRFSGDTAGKRAAPVR